MREEGLKETGVNTVLHCINAYLHWAGGPERKCGEGRTHRLIRQLREPHIVLPTFTDLQVKRLVAWKPQGPYQRRLHLVILLLLDTGCRISAGLSMHVSNVNFEDLLVTLDGKGRKQRVVPFSFELRKALFRYMGEQGRPTMSVPIGSRSWWSSLCAHGSRHKPIGEFRRGIRQSQQMIDAWRHSGSNRPG